MVALICDMRIIKGTKRREGIMSAFSLEKIQPVVREKLAPFISELAENYNKFHSVHIVGSAVTSDYDPDVSDINTVVVLEEMDLAFLDHVAPLGKKHKKKGIAPPLIMTPAYISDSVDVFPVEFLNFKLVHETVLGTDLLRDLVIERADLRNQCEREIKIKLIWLRQNYISSMGDRKLLLENITASIGGFIPLFRGILSLLDKEPPVGASEVVKGIGEVSHFDADIFEEVYKIRHKKLKPTKEQIEGIFQRYYRATENIGSFVNDLQS